MIVVTGSTGTIGRLVVRTLLARGAPLRIMARDPTKAQTLFGADAPIVVADFGDLEALKHAFEGATAVFVLSAPADATPNNDRAAIEAALATGVARIVKMSSLGADTPAATNLASARWHGPGETALRASGIAFTILRPAGFDSNALAWKAAIRAGTPIEITTASGRHPFVDPRDVAEVAAEALESDSLANRILTLTGPVAMTARGQLDVIASVLGEPIESVEVPLSTVAARLRSRGLDEATVTSALAGQTFVRDGHSATVHEDLARALGRPARPFRAWVVDHASQFR